MRAENVNNKRQHIAGQKTGDTPHIHAVGNQPTNGVELCSSVSRRGFPHKHVRDGTDTAHAHHDVEEQREVGCVFVGDVADVGANKACTAIADQQQAYRCWPVRRPENVKSVRNRETATKNTNTPPATECLATVGKMA
jgi:hypothetical protein